MGLSRSQGSAVCSRSLYICCIAHTVCSFQYIPRGFSSVPEDLGAMMDLGAFQPAIAMIFHVESEFAVQNAGFLRPDPERYRIFPEMFRSFYATFPDFFEKDCRVYPGFTS